MSVSTLARRLALPVLVSLLATGALTMTALPTAEATLTRAARVADSFTVARHQIGDRYAWGAAGPNRFDCSGLTYYSLHTRSGFSRFPRSAAAQARFARHIRRANMHRGDLIFFYNSGGVYHVGMFAGWSSGHRLVLHAPHTGARVRVERVWTNRWFAGTLRR
jgi:cell wall-associated NlpC family hydrolase